MENRTFENACGNLLMKYSKERSTTLQTEMELQSFWHIVHMLGYFEVLQQLLLPVPLCGQPIHLTPFFFSIIIFAVAAPTIANKTRITIIFAIIPSCIPLLPVTIINCYAS
jgi:hypothetical protein